MRGAEDEGSGGQASVAGFGMTQDDGVFNGTVELSALFVRS